MSDRGEFRIDEEKEKLLLDRLREAEKDTFYYQCSEVRRLVRKTLKILLDDITLLCRRLFVK